MILTAQVKAHIQLDGYTFYQLMKRLETPVLDYKTITQLEGDHLASKEDTM